MLILDTVIVRVHQEHTVTPPLKHVKVAYLHAWNALCKVHTVHDAYKISMLTKVNAHLLVQQAHTQMEINAQHVFSHA